MRAFRLPLDPFVPRDEPLARFDDRLVRRDDPLDARDEPPRRWAAVFPRADAPVFGELLF